MKHPLWIVFVVLGVAVGAWYVHTQQKGGDDFLRKQAIQSALFPELGPLTKEFGLQPADVVLRPDSFGVVLNVRGSMGDHSERENLRAKIQIRTREWAKTRPELQGLRVFVQFSDELDETNGIASGKM